MELPQFYLEDEVRDGFYVSAKMKMAWAAQLEVLSDIDRICKKYNITYFAEWGTLLGAIRNGGIIPWDDDMDICMKRDDFTRFQSIAERELPEGYSVLSAMKDGFHQMIIRVINTRKISVERSFLEKFHGFPFAVGIDIFPLDYMAPSEQEDIAQRGMISAVLGLANNFELEEDEAGEKRAEDPQELEKLVLEIEKMCQVKLDRTIPYKRQLFALADRISSMYKENESDEITNMYIWTRDHVYRLPKPYYDETILVPFENLEIPVPAAYDQILHKKYGNYMRRVQEWDSHDYPFYKVQEELLEEQGAYSSLPYHFSYEDLELGCQTERGHSEKKPKEKMQDFLQSLFHAHDEIKTAIACGNLPSAYELLELCQNGAIEMGGLIEAVEGEGFVTVGYIEDYCEHIYQCYQCLNMNLLDEAVTLWEQSQQLLYDIENSVEQDIPERRTMVFLPYKASMWDSMESIWRAADADPHCQAYVIPIPYYERNIDGSLGRMCDESGMFPDDVPIVDYRLFDFNANRPDMIIIHNPYDKYNPATSVDPFFYSDNLKKLTDKLIYVPRFLMNEFSEEDYRTIEHMKYFCMMPGVVRADLVIVQSEQMRQRYIQILTQLAGEETRTVWEKKIVGLGSPIMDHKIEEPLIPEEWLQKIEKPQGSYKKVCLYSVSSSMLLHHGEQALADMERLIAEFRNRQDEEILLWYTHSVVERIVSCNSPEIWKRYQKMTELFKEEGWGIYDNGWNYLRVIFISDSIYGDLESVARMCMRAEKTYVLDKA